MSASNFHAVPKVPNSVAHLDPDVVVEIGGRRLDLAEKNIYEPLTSDDSRRRDAASMFTIRNSHRARRRGWITTSTRAAELSVTANANNESRTLTFRWRN